MKIKKYWKYSHWICIRILLLWWKKIIRRNRRYTNWKRLIVNWGRNMRLVWLIMPRFSNFWKIDNLLFRLIIKSRMAAKFFSRLREIYWIRPKELSKNWKKCSKIDRWVSSKSWKSISASYKINKKSLNRRSKNKKKDWSKDSSMKTSAKNKFHNFKPVLTS